MDDVHAMRLAEKLPLAGKLVQAMDKIIVGAGRRDLRLVRTEYDAQKRRKACLS